MWRFTVCVFAIALASPAAAPPANFSGTWQMDPSRSESAHQSVPVGPVTLVISQSPSDLTIKTRTAERDKNAVANETLTFKADGSESTVVGEGGVPVKSKLHWEGAKLITETIRSVRDSTVSTRYVFSINPGATELTLEKNLTVQHGYMGTAGNSSGKGKDVFVKQKTSTQQ